MGVASLINRQNISGGDKGIDYEPSSIVDVYRDSLISSYENYQSNSAYILQSEQIKNQYNLISEFEGQPLEEIIGVNIYDSDDRWKATDEFINKQREIDPRYNDVPTLSEMRNKGQQTARNSMVKADKTSKGASPFERVVGGFLGGMGSALIDPVNIGVTAVTAGGGLLFGASRSALRVVAIEAGIGAGTELAIQPTVAAWQREVGNDYGLGDALTNVAFAGLVSGGLAGITSGALKQGVVASRDKAGVFFETVASGKNTPDNIRPIMERMSKYARVKEETPFDAFSPAGDKAHLDNVERMNNAFNQRATTKARDVDLDLSAGKIKPDVSLNKTKPADAIPRVEEEFTALDYRGKGSLSDVEFEQIKSAEYTDFERLIESDPNFNVVLDDAVEARVSDMGAEIKAAQAVNDIIRTCAV